MTHPYRTGRIARFDSRSLGYPARQADEIRTVVHRTYGTALQQGDTSSCVGHAVEAALTHKPIWRSGESRGTHTRAMDLYAAATRLDPFPWTYPPSDDGSSVLAGAKAAKNAGLITGYRWAFGLTHALKALSLGPVIIGITWYEGMFYPDHNGRITPSGSPAGGHACLLKGNDASTREALILNSWGPEWGDRGRARISWDHLDMLLADRGEAVVPERVAA